MEVLVARVSFVLCKLIMSSAMLHASTICTGSLKADTIGSEAASIFNIALEKCSESEKVGENLIKVAEFGPNDVIWTFDNWRNPLELLTLMLQGKIVEAVHIELDLKDKTKSVTTVNFVQEIPWKFELVLDFGQDSLIGMPQLVDLSITNMAASFTTNDWLSEESLLKKIIFTNSTVHDFTIPSRTALEEIVFEHTKLVEFPVSIMSESLSTLIMQDVTILRPIRLKTAELRWLKALSNVRLRIRAPFDAACPDIQYFQNVPFCISDEVNREDDLYPPHTSKHFSRREKKMAVLYIIAIITGFVILVLLLWAIVCHKRFLKKMEKADCDINVAEDHTIDMHEYEDFSDQRRDPIQSMLSYTAAQIRSATSFGGCSLVELKHSDVKLINKAGMYGLFHAEYQGKQKVMVLVLDPDIDRRWKVHIAVEYQENGALRSLLLNETLRLSWQQRILMCLDVCSAVQYLHALSGLEAAERRLRASSVLCSSTYACKLDVFDCLPGIRRHQTPALAFGEGLLSTFAPEVLTGGKITLASEIYALGVIMCEISLMRVIYHEMVMLQGHLLTDCEIVSRAMKDSLDLKVSSDAPLAFQNLITECLRKNPEDRPTVSSIMNLLIVLE